MTRPQRNLLLIISPPAVLWLILRTTPWIVGRWIGLAFIVLLLFLLVWGRDLPIGRYRMHKRDWRAAIESFKRFERRLQSATASSLLVPMYASVYTFDGVAVARNNIAIALMKLGEFDEAEGWLRSALRQDPLYALAYLNLGIIAAVRKDEAGARRQFQRAVDLGYSAASAQLLLRRALAGKALE